MRLVFLYAVAAGFLGLIPVGATPFLLILEGVMFYHVCYKHGAPVLGQGIVLVVSIGSVNLLIKFLVGFLHVIVGLGQVANVLVAFLIVLGLGRVILVYAKNGAAAGRAPESTA